MSGDMNEDFAILKRHSRQKRRSNLENSTQLLTERGIKFVTHNGGIHIEIASGERVFDFWPSTGRYIERKSKAGGRGVFNLLKQLEGG